MKTCRDCGQEKPLEEYCKAKTNKDGRSNQCKACARAYYQSNRERLLAQQKERASNRREEIREYNQRYREANRDKLNAASRASYAANREGRLEYAKDYYRANTATIRARQSKYERENRETVRRWNRNKYRRNPAPYRLGASKHRALKVLQLHHSHCFETEKALFNLAVELERQTGIRHDVDHVFPLSKGGPHWHENLQVIPASVNRQKHDSLTFVHPACLHWTDLPQHVLDSIAPADLAEAEKAISIVNAFKLERRAQ